MNTTLNPTEKYIDISLNDQNFSLLILSVQLSLKDISFCISDQEDKCYAVVSYSFSEKQSITALNLFLTELFRQEDLFQHDYLQVFVSYKHSHATLIPSAIFDKKYLSEYLSLVDEHIENQSITFDYIAETDAYNVYIFPQLIQQTIFSRYPKANLLHHSSVFIKSIYINYPSITDKTVYVNVNNNEFEICIIKQSGLQLYNTFQFKTKEDYLYYLIFIMKQMDCDPAQHKVILSGKIANDSAIFQLMYKYIKDVSFVDMKITDDNLAFLKDVAPYYYFTLLNLKLCAS
jgi:hypothetical protein